MGLLSSLAERWRPPSPSPSDAELSTALRTATQEDYRIFQIRRTVDISGVSGLGLVAHGIDGPDGLIILRWHGEITSVAVYRDLAMLERVHGHGGTTKIEWLGPDDDPEDDYNDLGELILIHSNLTSMPWFRHWV